MTSVVVFDYGFGNVRSMVRALANLDLDVTLTSDHVRLWKPTDWWCRVWARSAHAWKD